MEKKTNKKFLIFPNFCQKQNLLRMIYFKTQRGFTPLEVTETKKKHKALKPLTGFTLIEMMVTVALFSIIVASAVGIFVSAISLQRFNLTHQQLLDQTSYAMEYMDRAIRMAKKDDDGVCTGTAGTNYWTDETHLKLKFKNYKDECQEFFLESGQLKTETTSISEVPLTGNDFEVTSLKFNVSGDSAEEDYTQPRVTISMEIQGKDSGSQPKPKIRIQTTVSQRNLDRP